MKPQPQKTRKVEPFIVVVNKYGSGMLYTERVSFHGEGTFEEWRDIVSKAFFDPSFKKLTK